MAKTKVTAKNFSSLSKGRYSVGDGLSLLVSSETSRSWIFRYQFDGKRKDFSLGSANVLSLTSAKAKITKLRAMIAEGIDPAQERKARKQTDVPRTFKEVVDEAIPVFEKVRQWKNAKHANQWRATLDTYALPVFGSRILSTITRDDILKAIEPIWLTKTETAKRLRGRIEAVFDFAISKGYCDQNPARWKANLETFLPPPSKIQKEKHHASMPLEELQKIAPVFFNSTAVSKKATLFAILTASRIDETLSMTWDEIDFDSETWNLHIERTKTSVPHRVPLSRQAMMILKSLPRINEFVFPSPYKARKAMTIDTPLKLIQKVTGEKWTVHGFRSTFRDWGEENFIHDTLLEKALSHSQKSKTVRAYQRSDLLEQRRPIMQKWADAVCPIDIAEKDS